MDLLSQWSDHQASREEPPGDCCGPPRVKERKHGRWALPLPLFLQEAS